MLLLILCALLIFEVRTDAQSSLALLLKYLYFKFTKILTVIYYLSINSKLYNDSSYICAKLL